MAERLLLYWDKKHVGFDGWDGFLFSRNTLCYRGQRWKPDMLLEYHQREKRINALEYDMQKLNTLKGATLNLFNVIKLKLYKNHYVYRQ